MKTIVITFKGSMLEVVGEYKPYIPETSENPEEGGYFEIDSIWIGNEEVTELLDIFTVQIEDVCNDKIKEIRNGH